MVLFRFLFFLGCMLAVVQNGSAIKAADSACVHPLANTLQPGTPVHFELFYSAGNWGYILDILCTLKTEFNGQVPITFKLLYGSAFVPPGPNEMCNTLCRADRYEACFAKYDPSYNDCSGEPTADEQIINQCIDNGEADDVLLENIKIRANYGLTEAVLPFYVVNQTVDKCGTYDSYGQMKQYFCDLFVTKPAACGP